MPADLFYRVFLGNLMAEPFFSDVFVGNLIAEPFNRDIILYKFLTRGLILPFYKKNNGFILGINRGSNFIIF